MTEGTDLEELMDELNDHKSELAEKKDELDQAIEEENESGIRDILKKLGLWKVANAAWDALKIAVRFAMENLP
jgi:predicted transcriptional regulator